jgi:hypothetical protein
MDYFRTTKKSDPAAGGGGDDDSAPPPAPAPPPKGLFGGVFKKKKGGAGGDGGPAGDPALPSVEEHALAEERAAWLKDEADRRFRATEYHEDYTPQPMPERLQDAAYKEAEAEKLELRRIEHDRQEELNAATLGTDYARKPFEADAARAGEDRESAAPPVAEEGGKLAERFGEQAYGGGQLNRNTSYAPGVHAPPRVSDPAADVYGGAPAGYAAPAAAAASKPGWAGIFTRTGPPPPNPFTGPIVMPQTYMVPPVQSRAQENGIPYDVMQRLNEGRGLATLALNNHEGAPVLAAKGQRQEALAAYQAADAGYERALQLLMPARKALMEGPESSRVVRAREKDRLEKLIAQILDHWEEVKPNLIPDVPTNAAAGQQDFNDPLLDRLSRSVSKMGPGRGSAPPPPPPPPAGAEASAAIFSASGELDLGSLPSVPTHDVPLAGRGTPKMGGPKKCFVCITPSGSKPAELMTPCNHFMCVSCSESVFGLFNNCPECQAPCRRDQLKAIA